MAIIKKAESLETLTRIKSSINKAIKKNTSWFGGLYIELARKGLKVRSNDFISEQPTESLDIFFDDFFSIMKEVIKETRHLAERKAKEKDPTYVYCLYNKNESKPFYVGITKHLGKRLKTHKSKKGFDKALYIEAVNRESASYIEEAIIALIPALENDTAPIFNAKEYRV